jgi:AraC family transcriptional regulator
MEPKFITLNRRKFIGKRLKTSFVENKTFKLWREFMPYQDEIKNNVGNDLYSIEIYPEEFFTKFNPATEFEKWAAVEVTKFENVPNEMETLTSPEGLYAVFVYEGKSSEAAGFYQNIFQNWLPDSEFILDARPHFAVMGEKYRNDSDDSEEEVFIPVRAK